MNPGNQILARKSARGGFYVFRQGEEDGPFPLDQLEEMHRVGEIPASTPCRSRSEKEWHDLGFVLKFLDPDAPESEEETSSQRDEGVSDFRPFAGPKPVVATLPAIRGEIPAAAVSREPSMRELVSELIAVTRRQNQLLNSVKWGLLCVALVVAATGAIAIGLR